MAELSEKELCTLFYMKVGVQIDFNTMSSQISDVGVEDLLNKCLQATSFMLTQK